MVLSYVKYLIPHLSIPRMSQTSRELALYCFCVCVCVCVYVKKESWPGGTNIDGGAKSHGLHGGWELTAFYLEIAQTSRLACL